MLIKYLSGDSRSVWIDAGVIEDFEKWLQGLSTAEAGPVSRILKTLTDRSNAELQAAQTYWKFQRGTKPKIFAAKIGGLRLYCCMHRNDIVILEWARKQGQKADSHILARAQRRAAEVEEDHGHSEKF